MKIQILGINYAPEMISTAIYTTGMAEFLSELGGATTVVTAQPYYPEWKIRAGWPKFRYRTEKPTPNLRVIHCPLYVPRRPSGKTRLVHYATFALAALPRMLWCALIDRPEVILVVAPSLVSAEVGLLAARLSGAKCWLHIQDFEVEAAFATGAFLEGSRIGLLAKSFERRVLARFDVVSSISEPMLAKIVEKGVPKERVFELRNWADLSRVKVIEGESPLRSGLGITSRHVVLYSGNVAAKQGLEIIPVVARKLGHRDDLTFVIVGEGPFLAELKMLAEDLDNVRFFPLQPRERLSESLGMADIHLLPQIAGVADLVLPSKLTNMLASGRPVIATALPGTALANEVAGAGLITPPGDAEALADAISTLLDDPECRREMGREARAAALRRWDMSSILKNLETRLKRLAGTGDESDRDQTARSMR